MNVSSAGLARLGKAKALALAMVVAAFGMLALAGTSKAADHNLTVNHGKLTLGAVFPDQTIIPAPVAGAHCPTIPGFTPPPDPADCGPSGASVFMPNVSPNGSVGVNVLGNTATVAKTDFNMPTVYVPQPGKPDTMIPIQVSAPNGLSGTWEMYGAGELELSGKLRITIVTGVDMSGDYDPPPVILKCVINVPSVTWSTGPNAVTPGIPFDSGDGLDGAGALSAQWTDLPNGVQVPDGRPATKAPDDSTIEHSGDCSTVNSVIHDLGAIWLGVNKDTPPPAAVCEPPLEGIWPDCVEPPAPEPKVDITRVRVFPKKATRKAGQKVFPQIRIVNRGSVGGWVKVKLKVNRKKGVRMRKQIAIYAYPNTYNQIKVPFATNRRARGKYKVTATAAGTGKSGSATITVRPRKRR